MRRVFSLLAAAAIFGHDVAATVPIVYRNAGPDGTCACIVESTDFSFNTVSGAGLYTGSTSSVAVTEQGVSINVTNAALFGERVIPGLPDAGGAGGQGTMAFITPITQVYISVQNWFGIAIYGVFEKLQATIGSGGNGIDYVAANAGFPNNGPAIMPGASVFVQTVFTTIYTTTIGTKTVTSTIKMSFPTATTPLDGGSGVGAQPLSQVASSTQSSILASDSPGSAERSSSNPAPLISDTATTGSALVSDTVSTTTISNAAGQTTSTIATGSSTSSDTPSNPAGQYVILTDGDQEFGCRNESLVLLPVGQTGDQVFIADNGMLTCGYDLAYVQAQNGMKRRAITGRALSNGTQYYEIDLLITGPSTATTNGFSLVNGLLKLVVHDIELRFAVVNSILEAYDLAMGIPIGASTVVITGTPVARPSSIMTTSETSLTSATSRSSQVSTSALADSSSVTTGTTKASTTSGSRTSLGSSSLSMTSSGSTLPDTSSQKSSTTALFPGSSTTSSFQFSGESTQQSSTAPVTTSVPVLNPGGSSSDLFSATTADVYSTFSAGPSPSSDSSSGSPTPGSSSGSPTSSSPTGSSSSGSVTDFYPTFSVSGSSSSAAPTSTVEPEVISGCPLSQNTKNVFAHMIVGNLFLYSQADFYRDFKLAASYGIDAMALNVGRDAYELDRTSLAYAAALQLFTQEQICFKVFVSLDMSSLDQPHAPDGSYVTPYVFNFKSHPAQYYYQNKHFVSTYAGYQQFDWQATFLEPLAQQGIDVYFVPAYSVMTNAAAAYATEESSGQFLWNAWPNDATTGEPSNTNISPDLANEYIANKGSKSFMLNISPWFFTHFSNDVKNFVFHSEGLWQQRWNQAVQQLRDGTDFVQITSWNDFGESHYIGPIGNQEPNVLYPQDVHGVNSMDWLYVDDPAPGAPSGNRQWIDHSAFADEAKAWITAYKTGQFPAITPFEGSLTGISADEKAAALAIYQQDPNADRMYVSYRLQYNDAVTSEPAERTPKGAEFAKNVITIDTYLSTDGVVYIAWPEIRNADGTVFQQASQDSFAVNAGIGQVFAPFATSSKARRYGTPNISIATAGGTYSLQMDELWPIMTPDIALNSKINFNAYTKKFTRYFAMTK